MSYLLKLLLEKYDLRCDMDSAGTGENNFCEHRNINVSNVINIYQFDKCANECPELVTKH